MEVFICHIKRYRVAKDLTQEALAERVGVRRETIMRLEKGKYKLGMAISKVLEEPVETLFEFREMEN